MSRPSLKESIKGIKDRKVGQWGLAYLAGAWFVLQFIDVLGATYGWPNGLLRGVPVVLGFGFIGALVLAWYHGEQGRQWVSGVELSILTVLLGVSGLGVMLVWPGGADAEASEPEALDVLAEPSVDQTTLAVLPFEVVGVDAADYFAEGLAEELLSTLARVPALRVAARTSAFAFRDSDASADSVGRALGVAHLVEGTVRRSGDWVRVAARLIDTETGLQEWAKTYDRGLTDAFALQEEIARAVAFELRARVGAEAIKRGTEDAEAHALVLRADQIRRRGGDRRDTDPEANRLYEQALAHDSTYARAWAGLAGTRLSMAYRAADPVAEMARARDLAERALALDENEGRAHSVLGAIAQNVEGDLEATAAHYERAVAADPSDATALSNLALTLGLQDEMAGAVRAAERAVALDPLSLTVLDNTAWVYGLAGLYDQSVEMYRAVVALAPENIMGQAFLGNALATAGETAEALDVLARVRERDPEFIFPAAYEAYALARAGQRTEAERALASLPEGAPANIVRAAVETALGDRDAAFAALRRAYDAGEPYLEQIPTDPWFHPLRDDSRWDRLISRVDIRGPKFDG